MIISLGRSLRGGRAMFTAAVRKTQSYTVFPTTITAASSAAATSVAPPPTTTRPREKKNPVVVLLREEDLVEKFVRGRGPGGQCINKNESCVQLTHIPSGLRVAVQDARDLTTNRKIARKRLRDKLDLAINKETSKLGKRVAKIRKRKAKTKHRQNAKARDEGGESEVTRQS